MTEYKARRSHFLGIVGAFRWCQINIAHAAQITYVKPQSSFATSDLGTKKEKTATRAASVNNPMVFPMQSPQLLTNAVFIYFDKLSFFVKVKINYLIINIHCIHIDALQIVTKRIRYKFAFLSDHLLLKRWIS